MANIFEQVETLLLKDERVRTEDGVLLKNKVHELANKLDPKLLEILLKDETANKLFFQDIAGVKFFDKDNFAKFINNKNFLPDSYTSFKNKIGLVAGDSFISQSQEVVLSFPYKDCLLEGGQDTEDSKRDEVFWNEILAPDEVDRLLDPKALRGWKKYGEKGPISEFKLNNNDNLIIKGNNLLALHSLRKVLSSKVKLIYIDPPYYFADKKDGDSFSYNSNFKLSTWLVFMKNRLEIARDLLASDGAFFVQISDDGAAHLKVLLDEVFGQENFLNVLSVRMKNIAGASGGGEDKKLKKNIEFIYIYSKDALKFKSFKSIYDYKELYQLVQDYKENEVSWKYTSILFDAGSKKYLTSTKDGDGNEIKIYTRSNPVYKSISQIVKDENISEKEAYYKYRDKIYTTAMPQSSIRTRVLDTIKDNLKDNDLISIEYVPRSGRNRGQMTEQFYKGTKLRLFSWLKDVSEIRDGKIYKKELQGTYWDGFNLNNLSKEGRVQLENGKKPEALLQRIIEMATDEGDLVLDYHLGSGTTCAVAHKMGRRFVGVEQLDYGQDDSIKRLQNVVAGDESGISKSVDWKGGGTFVTAELAEANEFFKTEIERADNSKQLVDLWHTIEGSGNISYKVDVKKFNESVDDFKKLSLNDQKLFLLEALDLNHMYVNYSDIDDEKSNISDRDKKLSKEFYELG